MKLFKIQLIRCVPLLECQRTLYFLICSSIEATLAVDPFHFEIEIKSLAIDHCPHLALLATKSLKTY